MIQTIIVAIIVTLAALYAAQRYAPKWAVRKFAAWVSTSVAAIGLVKISNLIAQIWTVESPTGKSCGSGCGSCGGCVSSSESSDSAANKADISETLSIGHPTFKIQSLEPNSRR